MSQRQRNFLRKQVIEYKELNGLRKGAEVSAIVDNQPEQGTVKWIGTIKGTKYIGIQFERPVGNHFPEMSGAAPFPCSVAHSRLVYPEDVKRVAVNTAAGVAIMENQVEYHHHHQSQDGDNYLLQPNAYLCLGPNNTGKGPNNTMNRLINHCTNNNNSDINEDDDDASEFVSTSSTTSSAGCDPIELNEYHEVLSSFYKYCAQAKRIVKECHAKYEELPIHCRFEECATLNLSLEKLKIFKSEVEESFIYHLERCKSEMETIMRYSDILLPSEERSMSREMQEIQQTFSNLDIDICSEIEGLENFTVAYQNLQDLLQERFSRLSVIKTRLVQIERNLVKDQSAICLRLKGMQSILSVLERDHDSCENHNSEFNRLLSVIQLYDYMDTSRMLSQTQDLILSEKQLLDEVRTKRVQLHGAKESYNKFMERYSKFQSWYSDYMKRLNETKVTGLDFDTQHPSLVTEREEKRMEFIEILASARNLRASIFDSSAVDKKIEALQDQWKVLVEKVYRTRSRKTV